MSTDPAFGDGFALWPEALARTVDGGSRPGLRVVDARTGKSARIPSGDRILVRTCVHLPAGDGGGRVGLTELRAVLIGDVLQRVAEWEGLQVVRILAVPDLDPEQVKLLDRAAAALGVHPPVAVVGPSEVRAALQGSVDVHVVASGADWPHGPDGVWIAVGDVGRSSEESGVVEALAGGAGDATALRLVLLSHPYRELARTDPQALSNAAETLRDWRRHVADWAHAPSRPVPDEIRRRVAAAFTCDLDTPAALALLGDVQRADGLAAGARFETFASADRVLALELTRDLGLL
ncbi:hypothetical protein [Kitasatospora azatica]|uniref:hypothetical protein n=1 Tax=Kitasatospora azatica TaxID=58347 RepID=UPI00068D2CF9|nr:hypothetical protein [Kitasatospora azatica]